MILTIVERIFMYILIAYIFQFQSYREAIPLLKVKALPEFAFLIMTFCYFESRLYFRYYLFTYMCIYMNLYLVLTMVNSFRFITEYDKI